jgi:hypothetical protein
VDRIYCCSIGRQHAHEDPFGDQFYAVFARQATLDPSKLVFRLKRQPDTVQTDHIDWGFRSTALFGIDYRFMTAAIRPSPKR